MNDDPFSQDEMDFPSAPAFVPRSPLRRVVVSLLVLVGLVAAAEYGYRFYDQNTSHEVRPQGIELEGIVVSGDSIDFSVSLYDTSHALHLSVSSDNATDADADAARFGIIGTLSVQEENGARRCWTAPIQLIATNDRIVRRASIEDALQTAAAEGIISLGVRHRIDYSVEPDPISPDELTAMRNLVHPAGSRLSFHLQLERPLQRNSRIFLSYARAPRLLHQALLRPHAAQLTATPAP